MTRSRMLPSFAAALTIAFAASPALALPGADTGDSYINDLQHNPRLIEPYQGRDPARYRIGNPYAGYEDRQAARDGYYSPDSGYDPARRGRVRMEFYKPR